VIWFHYRCFILSGFLSLGCIAATIECPTGKAQVWSRFPSQRQKLEKLLTSGVESTRLTLRRLNEGERSPYVAFNQKLGAYYHLTDDPKTVAEHAELFASMGERGITIGEKNELKIVLGVFEKESNSLVGTFHMRYVPEHHLINIGVGVDEKYRRTGYATEFTEAGINSLKQFFPDAPIAWSTNSANQPSIRMAEKLGFKFSGKSPVHSGFDLYLLQKK
jgi:RimJ/RimL family protein N-acetyltransferase